LLNSSRIGNVADLIAVWGRFGLHEVTYLLNVVSLLMKSTSERRQNWKLLIDAGQFHVRNKKLLLIGVVPVPLGKQRPPLEDALVQLTRFWDQRRCDIPQSTTYGLD